MPFPKRINKIALLLRNVAPNGTVIGDLTPVLPLEGTTYDMVGERIDRKVVRPTLSQLAGVTTAMQGNLNIIAELKGGGLTTLGVLAKPEIDPLLQASTFVRKDGYLLPYTTITGTFKLGETLVNTTQADEVVGEVIVVDPEYVYVMFTVVGNMPIATDVLTGQVSGASFTVGTPATTHCYHLNSEINDTNTLAGVINKDGHSFAMSGGRLSPKFTISAGQFGTVTFTGNALSVNPTDVPLPTNLSYNTIDPPVCVNMGLKIGDLDMSQISVNNFEMDCAVAMEMVRDLNTEGFSYVDVTGRAPVGSLDPTAPALAAFNPYTALTSSTRFVLTAKLGNVRGNRVRFVISEAVITEATDTPQSTRRAYGINFQMTANSRDDREFILIFY